MSARHLRSFVNGEYVESSSDDRMDVINPATEVAFATSPISNERDVETAYDAAAKAFDQWGESTPSERQLALFRIADALEERAEEFADAESLDTGKPRASLVEDEILVSVDQIRFFAGAARVLEGRAAGEYMRDHTSMIRREPIGVIGQVTPWNYPLNMATWKLAPAIAAGNTIVLKPSDTTPVTTLMMAELAQEFLPKGVFNAVAGNRDTGRAMVQSLTPQMVSVTGSVRAGMEVAKSAANDLKRVHLELGGKAPVIVFNDADIELAVETIVAAGYFNAGQDCTAATRLLVQEDVHDEFVAALAAYAARNARTGAPAEAGILFGALNNESQFQRVQAVIGDLPENADVVLGGKRQGDRGYFLEATIVSGLDQRDDAIQNEIFGPVITVQSFTDEQQALALANDVKYGLASSVWTSNHSRAMRFAKNLDFGVVWINTHIPAVAEMPHGGFKHSGYGKDLSMYGFEDYTRIKHVMSYIGS